MNEDINEQINNIGSKIDMIYTLIRALMSSMLGSDELTEKDADNLLFLLEDKIKELKQDQNKLIDKLGI